MLRLFFVGSGSYVYIHIAYGSQWLIDIYMFYMRARLNVHILIPLRSGCSRSLKLKNIWISPRQDTRKRSMFSRETS